MEEKYQKLKEIAENALREASPAHDINHVMRVYNLCLHLAKHEPDIDLDVLKTAALLHDIARTEEDKKGHIHELNVDHAILGAEMSEKILRELAYSEEKIKRVKHCIVTHRFRSGNEPETKEACIRRDRNCKIIHNWGRMWSKNLLGYVDR